MIVLLANVGICNGMNNISEQEKYQEFYQEDIFSSNHLKFRHVNWRTMYLEYKLFD